MNASKINGTVTFQVNNDRDSHILITPTCTVTFQQRQYYPGWGGYLVIWARTVLHPVCGPYTIVHKLTALYVAGMPGYCTYTVLAHTRSVLSDQREYIDVLYTLWSDMQEEEIWKFVFIRLIHEFKV